MGCGGAAWCGQHLQSLAGTPPPFKQASTCTHSQAVGLQRSTGRLCRPKCNPMQVHMPSSNQAATHGAADKQPSRFPSAHVPD